MDAALVDGDPHLDLAEALGTDLDAHLAAVAEARGPHRVESEEPFDLVLCDPPWAVGDTALPVLGKLARAGKLRKDARVVLEHSSRVRPEPPDGLVRFDERAFGDSALSFLRPAIYSAAEP